ncbi:hypothetical protein [Sorangium sp. So ce176]|uniref:hypothetical protein n=1 Tax=Sorangium sp. So ce176 TaxID=3133286 RepID=UPI003F617C66
MAQPSRAPHAATIAQPRSTPGAWPRGAPVLRTAQRAQKKDPILEELEARLLAPVDHDAILALAPETLSKQVRDEGICGALNAAFVNMVLSFHVVGKSFPKKNDYTEFFSVDNKDWLQRVAINQQRFRKAVLKDIDTGYAVLFDAYALVNLGEPDSLQNSLLGVDGAAILVAFEFRDSEGPGGHGMAAVRTPAGVVAFDPNEGVFLIPTSSWAQWVKTNLLSGYGKIVRMTLYLLRMKRFDEL